jgi:hypothetical protein
MSLDLTAALARALPEPAPAPGARIVKAARFGSGPAAVLATGAEAKPVLQLSDVPLPLNPADYRNAYSNTNPQGDQRTLYAFRALVDPVPEFGRAYQPSARSTERIYQNLVQGASVQTGQDFATAVLATARKAFEDSALENLVITPGKPSSVASSRSISTSPTATPAALSPCSPAASTCSGGSATRAARS